jgi:hypothetical protein
MTANRRFFKRYYLGYYHPYGKGRMSIYRPLVLKWYYLEVI